MKNTHADSIQIDYCSFSILNTAFLRHQPLLLVCKLKDFLPVTLGSAQIHIIMGFQKIEIAYKTKREMFVNEDGLS